MTQAMKHILFNTAGGAGASPRPRRAEARARWTRRDVSGAVFGKS